MTKYYTCTVLIFTISTCTSSVTEHQKILLFEAFVVYCHKMRRVSLILREIL